MRHLFGKEHKEQKSLKLVKKLQLEEDKKYQEDLQKRLEQEEKDAALARELQAQLELEERNNNNNNSSQNNSPQNVSQSSPIIITSPFSIPPTSPVASAPSPLFTSPVQTFPTTIPIISSPTNSVPPPLPSKPAAYNSGPFGTSNNPQQNGIASSSSQPNFPPPSYVANQPPLPPRERTASQVSAFMPSPMVINNNVSNHPNTSHHHPNPYHSSLNTAMTPGISHQFLNYQNYYPGTPVAQPQEAYPPPRSNTPQVNNGLPHPSSSSSNLYPPTNNYADRPPLQAQSSSNSGSSSTFNLPRRDPAMLIIPPQKDNQHSPPKNHVYPHTIPTSPSASNLPMNMHAVNYNNDNNNNNHSNNPYKNSNNQNNNYNNSNMNNNNNQHQYHEQLKQQQHRQSQQFFHNQPSFDPHHINNTHTPLQPISNNQRINTSTPSSSSNEPTSYPGTVTHVSPKLKNNISPPTAKTPPSTSSVTHISPKMTSSIPPPTSTIMNKTSTVTHISPKMKSSISTTSVNTMKPDTKWENESNRGGNKSTKNDNIDNDENNSLVFERNDGRMMVNQPITTTALFNRNGGENEKHENEGRGHINNNDDEEFDSDNYQSDEEDDNQHDDQAIDPFDINVNDTVVIRHHNSNPTSPTTHHQLSRKNTKISVHHHHDDPDHQLETSSNNPFTDSFAVESMTKVDPHQPFMEHGRSKSLGNIEPKPFQMNTNAPTIAMVHDPLLMRATAANAAAAATTASIASSTPSFTKSNPPLSNTPGLSSRPSRPVSTLPWSTPSYSSSNITMNGHPAATPSIGSTVPRPASVFHHPVYNTNNNINDDDDELVTLDSNEIQYVAPTNTVRAGAPPHLQSMINQVTAEVPSNEFGYYQYDITKPGGEKEEVDEAETIEEAIDKALPTLPKSNPDHRHITVPSVIEDTRVWIRVHPTDTGKQLASRIQIVATYKTRKITKITTDRGRNVPLDETPVFTDWADVMQMKDGTPWKVEWTLVDHNLWEGPKEFLRYLKSTLRS
ncbi:hypothetical protein BJ944DRAFT_251169 [Cunninghamella echinulata]|nr:hypothetical protein BJ944DRAFT_251169 [Cunninghamella echinulata]